MGEIIQMSIKELERLRVLQKTVERELTQKQASLLLNLTERQVRKLIRNFKKEGVKSLISKKRGKPSNRQKEERLKKEVLKIISEKYKDFGPTLIQEKLKENHQISIGVETVRQWMSQSKLWFPKKKKQKTHPLRRKRDCFGELIQIDGSHHAWFEERGQPCVLLVFIDDATGKLTSLHFSEGESLEGYFASLKKHLFKYGRPKALYSDHFSVFEGTVYKDNLTQFHKALKTLDIQLILANSPQAKGRVERANRTLQDRLVKEMRLKGISSIKEANAYVQEFIEKYNHKFSKEPASSFNAHRSLDAQFDLDRCLTRYEERTLTKDLLFQFHNTFYKILEPIKWFKGQTVEIRVNPRMRIFLKDKELKFKPLNEIIDKHSIDSLPLKWKKSRGAKFQPSSHPWKNPSYKQDLKYKEMRKVV
jgi:transposase